jgi:(p)ppGpp synthase/HD superfamily hydrolase
MTTAADPDPAVIAPRLGRGTEEAFSYALAVHGAQVRKALPVLYTSHLLAVASLVLEDGGDETQVIAALLHDAAEDQGGEARLADIRSRFGPEVAAIVEALSDSLVADAGHKGPWRERKEEYLARLRAERDAGVLRVALADKLHNARCMVTDVSADADAWLRFKAGPADTAWYYGECFAALAAAKPGNRFVAELAVTVARLSALADAEMARRLARG